MLRKYVYFLALSVVFLPSVSFADVGPDVDVDFSGDDFVISNLTSCGSSGGVIQYNPPTELRTNGVYTSQTTVDIKPGEPAITAGMYTWNTVDLTVSDVDGSGSMVLILACQNAANFNFTSLTNAISASTNWEPYRQDVIFLDFNNECWGRDTISVCTEYKPIPVTPPEMVPFVVPLKTDYVIASTSCLIGVGTSTCEYFYTLSTSTNEVLVRFDGLLFMLGFLLLFAGISVWYIITRKLT